jgi:hypothetical protein
MKLSVADIAAMERGALLALWRETVDTPPPRRLSTPFLRRMLAWDLQARRHGGLPPALATTLGRIAEGKDRTRRRKLRPGGRLVREWNGVTHVVDVVADGYLWRGTRYRSLSAIAREITGAHWSGPRFFGLRPGDAR